MNGRLSGKCALVTGAGAGIGKAMVLAFAAEGARVIATNRAGPSLDALRKIDGLEVVAFDVTDDKAPADLARTIPLPDIVANVAGYVHDGTILDCSAADWRRSFDINVDAVFRLTQAFLPAMLERGSGNFINVASVAGAVKGFPRRFAYGATKAAIVGFTRGLAVDFAANGIRANVICPGTIDTPSLEARAQATGDRDKAWQVFIGRQPVGRLGRPEEIAALAVHLAADESAYTTGAVYVADGGSTA